MYCRVFRSALGSSESQKGKTRTFKGLSTEACIQADLAEPRFDRGGDGTAISKIGRAERLNLLHFFWRTSLIEIILPDSVLEIRFFGFFFSSSILPVCNVRPQASAQQTSPSAS